MSMCETLGRDLKAWPKLISRSMKNSRGRSRDPFPAFPKWGRRIESVYEYAKFIKGQAVICVLGC